MSIKINNNFDIYRWIRDNKKMINAYYTGIDESKIDDKTEIDDRFYEINEYEFEREVSDVHSIHDRRNIRIRPLTYTYGNIMLPFKHEDGTIDYTEQTCLCFIPAMRDFYAEQNGFNLETAKKYVDKVEKNINDGFITPLHITKKIPFQTKINISPKLKDDKTHPYTPYFIDPNNENTSNLKPFTDSIMENLLRKKILEIDPHANEIVETKLAHIDEIISKPKKIITSLGQYFKDTTNEVKHYFECRKTAKEYEKKLASKEKGVIKSNENDSVKDNPNR